MEDEEEEEEEEEKRGRAVRCSFWRGNNIGKVGFLFPRKRKRTDVDCVIRRRSLVSGLRGRQAAMHDQSFTKYKMNGLEPLFASHS